MRMKDDILLRPLKEKDAPLMLEWLHDPDIVRNFRFDANSLTMDSVCTFIKESQEMKTDANFAIAHDETDEYFGTVSLKHIDRNIKSAEYAISLRKKAQGRGYGQMATVKILEHAFYGVGLERVYLNVLSDNENAVRFYEEFGFVYEGEFLSHICIGDKTHSLKWFRLMKNEYERIKKSKVNTVNDVKMLEFPELGDDRGHLVVVEGGQNIPFEIKRIFYIYGSNPDVVRGQHANRRSAFCLINVSGKSKVKAIDQYGGEKRFILDRPRIGLYIPSMIWKDMYDFSTDSVLLVLSNEHYDGGEYIRDLNGFLKEVKR